MGKSSKTTQNSRSTAQSSPYALAQPLVDDFVTELGGLGGRGVSDVQSGAYDSLKARAGQGDPYAANKAAHTNFLYNQAGPEGRVAQAYDDTSGVLKDYASGAFLDPTSNPQIQEMLTLVGDNAFDRVNSAFAGAGRDITGNASGPEAAARGVAQAQLPILFDQFNRQQGLQQQAIGQLNSLAGSSAGQQGQFGAQAAGMGDAALSASNYGDERLIDIEQKIKGTPYEDLGLFASLLFPTAGLGGTTEVNQTGTGKARQGLSLFSDRRLKRNIRAVGDTYDGQTIYAYEMVGTPGVTQIGLIAQEVQEDHPDAVTERLGYLMVDYAIALDNSANCANEKEVA